LCGCRLRVVGNASFLSFPLSLSRFWLKWLLKHGTEADLCGISWLDNAQLFSRLFHQKAAVALQPL
jgi:hypothetical protein